ncbi:hypothetical protein SAMN04487948_104396 [Halogranum amylolyticum]|uniref:Uncharacterized protein n=1 Tax=Halogranum amylolyticum TaxID=660520 RepID=A0A1H8S2J6_9EURY|nr:hypothetical protein [Halogranum amylolyticum]SEO72756.1 hypothetical protein SAMN04487948_104396 [Halogranum amylolyticum]
MRDQVDALIDTLQQELGADLRGVFWGDLAAKNYAVAYLHDDVRAEFDSTTVAELVDVLVDEQLRTHGFNELTHLLGELDVTVRVFEESTQLLAWDPRSERGVFVATTADETALPPVIRALRDLDFSS